MLSRLANVFRVPDLRNKVIFTLAIIALYQIGANVPVPGVNTKGQRVLLRTIEYLAEVDHGNVVVQDERLCGLEVQRG